MPSDARGADELLMVGMNDGELVAREVVQLNTGRRCSCCKPRLHLLILGRRKLKCGRKFQLAASFAVSWQTFHYTVPVNVVLRYIGLAIRVLVLSCAKHS